MPCITSVKAKSSQSPPSAPLPSSSPPHPPSLLQPHGPMLLTQPGTHALGLSTCFFSLGCSPPSDLRGSLLPPSVSALTSLSPSTYPMLCLASSSVRLLSLPGFFSTSSLPSIPLCLSLSCVPAPAVQSLPPWDTGSACRRHTASTVPAQRLPTVAPP